MTRPTNNKFILPIITFIIFLGIWEMVIIIGHYQPVLLPGPVLVEEKVYGLSLLLEKFSNI